MPASKKNNKHRSFRLRWWQFVLLAIALGLSIWGVQAFFRHKGDQRLLTEDLRNSGAALDLLAKELRTANTSTNPARFEYCYRASRKFEKGPIYCVQGISFLREGISEDQIQKDYAILDSVLASFNLLDFQDNTDGAVKSYYAPTDYPNNWCRIAVSKKYKTRTSVINGYEFRLDCLSGNFDKFIYPDRKSN